MNENNFLGTIGILWIAIIFTMVMISINNKLYDIREHINGTCKLENTYNGVCRLNQ